MKPSVPYLDILLKELKDPQTAMEYLRATMESEDPRVFLIALKDVIRAQCGVTKLSRMAHISREHLYDLLSKRGNPGFLTLATILSVLGYKFSIERSSKLKRAA